MTRLLAIVVLIAAGYLFFRYLIRMLKQATVQESEKNGYQHRNREHTVTEEEYRQILGLAPGDSPAAIRKKYKDLLSKYHPDKVQHLGIEFQDMAEKKTKAIMEAYEFFRKKYNL
jgi:preprotein translocase subunit Sec63